MVAGEERGELEALFLDVVPADIQACSCFIHTYSSHSTILL